jgi:hypothetical protein
MYLYYKIMLICMVIQTNIVLDFLIYELQTSNLEFSI